MTGHALRELESVVRQTLAPPMEATFAPAPEALGKLEEATRQLNALGFSNLRIEISI
jgi:hypothetical protein